MQFLINEVKSWIYEAGARIQDSFEEDALVVDTKTDRTDLVTNMDRWTQDFLIEKIQAFDPMAKILGEENGQNTLQNLTGRVFIIDPIDGTMNFVLEQENFCIMLGIYDDGQPTLGFVYDVTRNRLLWGGPSIGVFCNQERVNPPANKKLSEGLLGLNSGIYGKDYLNTQAMGKVALGVRMTGCAGVELSALILGKRIGYLTRLAPWDYAAAGVLLTTLGLKMSTVTGKPLNFKERELFLAGTPAAYEEMRNLIDKDKNIVN